MTVYYPIETIRQHATELLRQYERISGRPARFPLDAVDIAQRVFDLEVYYDDQGVLNAQGDGILGCIYPDGHPSPWGRDKVIVVNQTPTGQFDPRRRSDQHTVAHECAGHYVMHYLKGVNGVQLRGPRSCGSGQRKDPLEWQADSAAGELLMPHDKVRWLLDGKGPSEIINLEVYGSRFKEYFGANQGMMETRLHALGYRLLNGRYEWANHSTPGRDATPPAAKTPPDRNQRRTPNIPHAAMPQFDARLASEFRSLVGELEDLRSVFDDLFPPRSSGRSRWPGFPPRRGWK